MLRLENQNEAIVLQIVGYQFPEVSEDYDANWLNISFEIRTPEFQWQICNPCLLTWDVLRLVSWLRKAVTRDDLSFKEFTGMENDFSIRYTTKSDAQCELRITLQHGCIPLDILNREDTDTKLHLSFKLTNKELKRLADSTENAITSFPPRGKLGQRWLQQLQAAENGNDKPAQKV